MKYDASNIVVSVGRRGQGGKAVKRALAALKLIDRDEACVSLTRRRQKNVGC